MIDCCELVDQLDRRGWTSAAGVPCSTFAGPIEHLADNGRYIASPHEGLAVSRATGVALAGGRQVVIAQNSGLGNMVNPLASLTAPYAVPVLILMSLRGWPSEASDEPQHGITGGVTEALLSSLGVEPIVLDGSHSDLERAMDRADIRYRDRQSSALLFPMKSVGRHSGSDSSETGPAAAAADGPGAPSSRTVVEVLSRLLGATTSADPVVLSTTGYLSRYLFATADRPRNFYMQGSMGHVSSIAAGYAAADADSTVVVLDGDGAALMHLGAMAGIGAERPANLIHLIVDNGRYHSTGGQQTASHSIDFAAMAGACGYRSAIRVRTEQDLESELESMLREPGPHCLVVEADDDAGGVQAPARASASLALPDLPTRMGLARALAGVKHASAR